MTIDEKRIEATKILAQQNPQDIWQRFECPPNAIGWDSKIDSYLHAVLRDTLKGLVENAKAFKHFQEDRQAQKTDNPDIPSEPVLTDEQAEVLERIVNNSGLLVEQIATCEQLLVMKLLKQERYFDSKKGYYWETTGKGRAALKTHRTLLDSVPELTDKQAKILEAITNQQKGADATFHDLKDLRDMGMTERNPNYHVDNYYEGITEAGRAALKAHKASKEGISS